MDADLAHISALASLCSTSRHLNNIATRHLYHHVRGKHWWRLARTLLARKDLAHRIRSMRIPSVTGVEEADCPPQVVAYYDSQRKIYLDAFLGDDRDEAMFHLGDDELYKGGGNIPVEILSSLCPNLETLESDIYYFGTFRFCAPHSMLHLRSIALSHNDTRYGMSLEHVAPLFRAAPNITHALFCMVSSCDKLDVTLPKLISLDFRKSTFSGSSLVDILSACPNLKTFRYEMGSAMVGDEQFTLREARDVFLAHAPKLESLCLDTSDNEIWKEDWDEAEASEVGGLFAERGVWLAFKPSIWGRRVRTSRPFAP
ncbi:hypothetical protein NEMBOFW57_006307 [Staphylotrichum longicolle]|uniref:F-box domain-containing protein n=1 Tax=Staphylotrichum longicolle TaxID=669026 RepID=A0AAD4EYX9_9PEZI|nr:hypothetical protein NEMBOFW57_006307 [Staphylotrichum longicolle]